MALVEGMLLVYCLCKFGKGGSILASMIGLALYALCVFDCEYGHLLKDNFTISKLIRLYPKTLYNSFSVSIIWIVIGKCIAENEKKVRRIPIEFYVTTVFILAMLCYIEYRYAEQMCYVSADAFCLGLIPLCTLLFCFVLCLPNIKELPNIRNYSTVCYCSHLAIGYVESFLLKQLTLFNGDVFPGSTIVFISVLITTIILFLCIKKCSSYSKFISWLY